MLPILKTGNPFPSCFAKVAFIWFGFAALGLLSCRSMGPKTIPPDGFNYNERIALQENEQMLLNIVRMRYLEVPRFLNVASVINQYTRGGGAGINGSTTGVLGEMLGGSVSGNWTDRPTITYTPLTGKAFSQSLLTPLPPAVIFFLIQSGWAADRLLRMTSSSINQLQNEKGTPRGRRQSEPEYKELLETLNRLQESGLLGMHFGVEGPEVNVEIIFPEEVSDENDRNAISDFKSFLDLNPESNVFQIEYGVIQTRDDQIVVQTHSMLEMLANLSWYIDVPEKHLEDGRTLPTFIPDDPEFLRIRVDKNRPREAFLAIEYKDHWFYLDDRDVASKTTFAVIQILLSLASDGSGSVGPLISIGN